MESGIEGNKQRKCSKHYNTDYDKNDLNFGM